MNGATASADNNPIIYPAQDVMSLLGNAWSLFRANVKSSMRIVLIPTLLQCSWNLLLNLLAYRPFLTAADPEQLMQRAMIGFLGLLLGVPMFFVWAFGCCWLSRFYYSRIVPGEPLGIRDCGRYILRIAPRLSGLLLLLVVMLVSSSVLGVGLLTTGVSLSGLVMTALFHALAGNRHALPGVMMFFFLLVWGFAVLASSLVLIAVEYYGSVFPLIAVSTARDSQNIGWFAQLRRSYRHVFSRRFLRLTGFLSALFVFAMAINMALAGPIWLWGVLEAKQAAAASQFQMFPLHVQIAINIAAGMANLFVMPLTIAAMTLIWYDCQVRGEGLDLRLRLEALVRRSPSGSFQSKAGVEETP